MTAKLKRFCGQSVRKRARRHSEWLRAALEKSRLEHGSLMVETAISLLVILPIVLWLCELCMLTYTYSVLGDAARLGVRYAIVHGADSSNCSGPSAGCGDLGGANVMAVVKQDAHYSFHDVTGMTVQVAYPDSSSMPPSRVAVSISYSYVPYVKLPGIAHTLQLSAEGRIVY